MHRIKSIASDVSKQRGGMKLAKKVLIIDDEISVRDSFVLALEDTGYHVTTCENGYQGIEAMDSDRFDLIYLDLKMPGMNGVETLKEIRKKDLDIPVYIATAHYGDFADDLDQIRQENLDFEVLIKPLDRNQIIEITKSILN